MKAAIIGGGVVGCSIALELRRLGFEAAVFDKNGEVGHGSTSSSCGIVRRFYSQPGMIAMAHEGAHIWADWAEYLGPIDEGLIEFKRPGMLFIPPRMDESVETTVAAMRRLGIAVSVLSADEIERRFPFLDVSSYFPPVAAEDPSFFDPTEKRLEGAVFEEDAGYVVSPGLATRNLRRAGERDGVTFHLNRRITTIEKGSSGGFRLSLADGESFETDVVVNASGPHSARTNALAGVDLPLETRPLRREVHALANPLFDEVAGSPLPILGDLDGGIYARPETGGRDVIVGSTDPACDPLDFVADPDDFPGEVTEAYRQRQCLRLMKRVPDLRLGPPRGLAALYDVTVRDWYPIADRTDLPGYYVCIGTSGSSFKTAPVLGMLMAGLIEACENGADTDREGFRLTLPRVGTTIDTRFLSRLRGTIETSGTVIG